MTEADLIRRAVRVEPREPLGPDLDGPAGDLHWPRLVDLANEHGVLALVARSLKGQGWQGVPPDVVRRLVAYRAALSARNLYLTRQLLAILDLLGRNGITALPYKGPVLAAYAYGDLGMRPFSDLDLILAERDVLAARSVLIADGFRSLSPRTDSARPGALPPGYAVALENDGGVLVELHWKLAPSFPLTIDHLLPDVRPFALLDRTVPCFSPEHLLLVLCVHGGKHAWERLEWVCAVAHLIATRPDLDWDRVAAEAKAHGARRAVALGLALATGVGGARVPERATATMGPARVHRVARDIEGKLLSRSPRHGGPVARYSLRFRVGGLADCVRYLLYLRHPTEKDRAFLALPRPLTFLYLIVRPLRVVYEHGGPGRRGARQPRAGTGQAQRAMERQLQHQTDKAATLHGREAEVQAMLAVRWDRVQRRITRVKAGEDDPRMLEVGCGPHGLLFGAAATRRVGVDPLAPEYATLFPAWQRRVRTVAAAGERLPFADAAFDIVLCDNVVDHAEQPAQIVAEMARVLVPGGMLYFTVNVHHRLYSTFARAHRAWNAAGIPFEIGPFADHTFHFTPEQARTLFRDLPLEIRRDHLYLDEAKQRARQRRLKHSGHLIPLVFFKNARLEVIAERR